MTALRLQLAILFDSICSGLYVFISPHILNIGGNHSIIGIFTVAATICLLLSADTVKNFTGVYGKRNTLIFFLTIAVLTHIVSALTSNCWLLILSRCLYNLTNQAQHFYQDMLLDVIPKAEADYYLTTSSVLSSCGYIIGPVIAGCLFKIGFFSSCLLAAVLTITSIAILLTVPSVPVPKARKPKVDTSFVKRIAGRISGTLEKFGEADIEHNWDMFLMKFLFYASTSIFFMRYTQILGNNFSADTMISGLVIAYTNVLLFAGAYVSPLLNPSTDFVERAFIILMVSVVFACFAHSYFMYLIVSVPLVLSRCYINLIWKDLLSERQNDSLVELNNTIGIVSDLTVPILFGIFRDVIGFPALIVFSNVPLFMSAVILKKHSHQPLDQDRDKDL